MNVLRAAKAATSPDPVVPIAESKVNQMTTDLQEIRKYIRQGNIKLFHQVSNEPLDNPFLPGSWLGQFFFRAWDNPDYVRQLDFTTDVKWRALCDVIRGTVLSKYLVIDEERKQIRFAEEIAPDERIELCKTLVAPDPRYNPTAWMDEEP